MHIFVRKLLIFSVFIILCFSQTTLGAEKFYDQGNGTYTITREVESIKSPSLWDLPKLFVTSLFEPFINDAPKVLDWGRNQGRKLDKLGMKDYLIDSGRNIVKSVKETAQEDPLEFTLNVITQGGALALGCSVTDSTFVTLAVGTSRWH